MIYEVKYLLEVGVKNKVTFAEESIRETITQLRSLLSRSAEHSRFFNQFSRSRVFKKEALEIIKKKVLPAFRAFKNFLEMDYFPNARKGPGLISLGNLKGREYYQACLEYHTTVKNINATDLYQFGMRELEKSQKRFLQLTKILG